MPYLRMPMFKKLPVVAAACMAGSAIPKDRRGMRCTDPFCDFECVRMENCNMGDMGGDIDIDETTVRNAHACTNANECTIVTMCR